MLYRLTVSNFFSIGKELSLDMFPYGRLRKKKGHIYDHPAVPVLKSAAIYGANGSGKSNFVLALACLRRFVVDNTIGVENKRIEAFRLDDTLLQEPSLLEIEFSTADRSYRYGVALRAFTVVKEYLYLITPAEEEREPELIFSRSQSKDKADVTMNGRFQTTEKDRARISIYVQEFLKNSDSLLNLLAGSDAYPELAAILRWFEDRLVIIQPTTRLMNLAEALREDAGFKQMANTLLQSIDTGVSEIGLYTTDYDALFGLDDPEQKQRVLQQLTDGAEYVRLWFKGEVALAHRRGERLLVSRVTTPHANGDGHMTFFPEEESDGTRRVLDFLPLWHALFTQDTTVVIDEIGRSLHPNLVVQLLRIFLEGSTRGQLLFTTHDANLLQRDLLRRDEIWLMEKDQKGSSALGPLTDFKIRDDLDLRRGYLNGRFGGVPELRSVFPEDFVPHE